MDIKNLSKDFGVEIKNLRELISALEKKDIFEAITDLENKILKIKLTIDGKDK